MGISKNIARKVVFPVLMGLRFDKLLASGSSNNSCIINFHGVTDVIGNRFNNRHLDVNEFDKIIRYIKNNFKIVSLAEIFEIHRSKEKQNKKTVALTFDDGYINNFSSSSGVEKTQHSCNILFNFKRIDR